jgi:transaldolase
MTETAALSRLQRMVETMPTDLWNDSSAPDELEYAIARGAVGATSNPPITLEVLRKEPDRWKARARELHEAFPTWSETQVTGQIYEEIALRGAALLEPVFKASGGHKGRLSIQTDPTLYRDAERMLAQGIHLYGLAPHVQVKFPSTRAGIEAIEEATFRGVDINATVSFSASQAPAVAEAVERGVRRRQADGLEVEGLRPVCTIMVGRLDDWLKAVAERDDILLTPGTADWAGVAVFKRAYELFQERGHRTRLLAAAYRNHLHWSQLMGGDIVMTMTHQWQVRFDRSTLEVRSRIADPVPEPVLRELLELDEFRRAYEPTGLEPAEFDTYGATVRTLRQFITAYHDLIGTVRDFILPDPDRRSAAS